VFQLWHDETLYFMVISREVELCDKCDLKYGLRKLRTFEDSGDGTLFDK
jgi:hypothetical protein